jgi:hypothetical protein
MEKYTKMSKFIQQMTVHNMRAVLAIFIILLLTYCNQTSRNQPNVGATDSLPISLEGNSNSFELDTLANDIPETNDIDSTNNEYNPSSSSIRFEPYITFEDFKVDQIDNSRTGSLDFDSNEESKNFRSRLEEGFNSDTSNFAGHYTFVFWGCGSPCQSSMIIDRQTGKLYNAPNASLGYQFRVDSYMLIVNPPDSNGFYENCGYCKPIIFLFDEDSKTFKQIN